MSGDEDVPCLHFKKHYRFNFPFVPDNTDSLRHMIRVTGIGNVAVFGGDGVCVHNDGWMGRDIKDFMKVIVSESGVTIKRKIPDGGPDNGHGNSGGNEATNESGSAEDRRAVEGEKVELINENGNN